MNIELLANVIEKIMTAKYGITVKVELDVTGKNKGKTVAARPKTDQGKEN